MSKYIVKSNIPFGNALAYTRGQPIEAEAVEQNGWQDYVVSANTKEARQILAEATGEPLPDEDDKPATKPASSEKKG